MEEKRFSDLGFREREHLQEWLAENPLALGEDLLIIQKEFSGFQDTNERLDLLALDKQGNLVIIENKLDDSGKDVTWQVLKYASYCSNLTKDDIRHIYQEYLRKQNSNESAEEKISEFFDSKEFEELPLNVGATQRIIMVAGNFRKEVTSTVLWLMNFSMRIQCFKVTPYALGEQLFLNVDQVLPVQDSEEFAIKMANKAQEEIATQESLKTRHYVRLEFWQEFLQVSNKQNKLFANISPSKDNWIGISLGLSGVTVNLTITQKSCGAEVYFNRGDQQENKALFDIAEKMKADVEAKFGAPLQWDRMSDKITSKIKYQLEDVNVYDKEYWPRMIEFLVDAGERMERAFREPVKEMNAFVRKNKSE